MTTTPTVWQTPFQVNQDVANAQISPVITGLSDGNVLVAWQDHFGRTADSDIVGRIYDATLMTTIRGPFQLNVARDVASESIGSIEAMTNGGFVLVYLDSVQVRLPSFGNLQTIH